MNDMHCYTLTLPGRLEPTDLVELTAPGFRLDWSEGDNITLITFQADQAGLVGLMRRLHGMGFTLLAFTTELD